MRFSSDDFAPSERFAVWREFGRTIIKSEIKSLATGDFRGRATIRMLPDLGVLSCASSAVSYGRSADLIGSDDVVFSFGTADRVQVNQRGREALLWNGDGVLTLGAECSLVGVPEAEIATSLRIPLALISAKVANLEDRYCRRIPAETPALRLLRHYARIFDNAELLETVEMQGAISTHILDLVALTLGATRDDAEIAKARGIKAARLRALLSGIEQHLTNPALSAAWLGAQLGLSERYVQHLLSGAGQSFSELVRNKRVERARDLLERPSVTPRRIVDVAYEVGFGDLSNFNRAFRARFGCTPSDVQHRG